MDHNSSADIYVSPEDDISQLNLSSRIQSALKRDGIWTVEELAAAVESGLVRRIRNIGEQSIAEIESELDRVTRTEMPRQPDEFDAISPGGTDMQPSAPIVRVEIPMISAKVIRWQARVIEKQISLGLLHRQARIAGKSVADWLSTASSISPSEAFNILASIIDSSISICEELSTLLDGRSASDIIILLSRYGYDHKTLKEAGKEMCLSRERVRQVSDKLNRSMKGRVGSMLNAESVTRPAMLPALLRTQSALQIADDIGLAITYDGWERRIRSSGMVGRWNSCDYEGTDPVEVMMAVCKLLADYDIPELTIPDNLSFAIELAIRGTPHLPAKVEQIRRTLPRETEKLIRRHTGCSGGVHARWLSEEIATEPGQAGEILMALGYTAVSEDWFVVRGRNHNYEVNRSDPLERSLRKMSQYCGPLNADDICAGVRNAASRTRFPVPPPDVMEKILRVHGYKSEEGLYYWDGEINEQLSASELTIMNCLETRGRVVHHTELVQAFIEGGLSVPAVYKVLNSSSLFVRIGRALYKLRGRSVTREDIERAENAAEVTSVGVEVEYDKSGRIKVSATLSLVGIDTGAIFSKGFPNLTGSWTCFVRGRRFGQLVASDAEFRHLREPFKFLSCQAGSRVEFTFNTWDRSVAIVKVGGEDSEG